MIDEHFGDKDMRWSCCRMPELEAGGCTQLCDLCGQVPIIDIFQIMSC